MEEGGHAKAAAHGFSNVMTHTAKRPHSKFILTSLSVSMAKLDSIWSFSSQEGPIHQYGRSRSLLLSLVPNLDISV